MIFTAWIFTYHFVILDVMSVALCAVLTVVREAEAEPHIILGCQPLVLGAHHQPREAKLAHAGGRYNVSSDNTGVRLSPVWTGNW